MIMREDEEREECEIGIWAIFIAVIAAMAVSFISGYTIYNSPSFKERPFSDVLMMSILSPGAGLAAGVLSLLIYEAFTNGKPKKRINKNTYKF